MLMKTGKAKLNGSTIKMIKGANMEGKVLIRVEQALDLILAIPAHRSSNANHAKFGNILYRGIFYKVA